MREPTRNIVSFSRRRAVWTGVGLVAGIAAFVALLRSPVGRPDDIHRQMHFSPRQRTLGRELIRASTNRRGLSHLPRYVELKSNGPTFRAYLLDLTPVRGKPEYITAFMTASEEIERGAEPTSPLVRSKAVDVTEARLNLHSWPWGSNVDYMLIVFSNDETQVDVRVSYGK
jgi:hypothetical protein